MYKLSFFVPESHLDTVKIAVFNAGAGTIGNYEYCCWQTKGQGQFKPLAGSSPAIGAHNQIIKLSEWKVEMVCDSEDIKAVIEALKLTHPYEQAAYDVIKLEAL